MSGGGRKGFLKIVVIGDSGVGKTSILERYVNRRFSTTYKATIGADFLVKDVQVGDINLTLQIWDTAGLEKYQSFTASYYRGADACILVFDKTKPASFSSLSAWRDEFLHQGMPKDPETFPFVVVGNKCDLVDEVAVTTEAAEVWCASNGIPCKYFDVSALENVNITQAFREVCTSAAGRIPPTPDSFSPARMSLSLDGERTSGQDIRSQNVTACVAIANIVKSTLGPVGLDKMLVDEIGEVTVTNDGATILKELEVEHPAARTLVELAERQDREVGDGTTSVVILAAELLKRGNELVRQKIHPTSIISGYRLARKEAVKYIKDYLLIPTEKLEREFLVNAAKTSMSSKIIGASSEFFSNLAVDAVTSVRTESPDGKVAYPIKAINILKSHGRSSTESELVRGFALNCVRASQAMPKSVTSAKIALLDFNLQKHRMQLGVQVLVSDPKELEAIRQREADITKEKIQKILAVGANVILTTKGIDDTCMKYLVEAGVIGVRRCKKEDLRRIAVATGGVLLPNLADLEGEESFDPANLGIAEEVSEERVGDGELIFIRGTSTSRATTIILRGANEFMLDEMDRSLHDTLCVVRRVLESKSLVAGGGAVEAALSIYLESFATTLGTREQLAIAEFAQALLVIPKTLAVNAAQDATDLVSQLLTYHNTAQKVADKTDFRFMGLDLINGKVVNNMKCGVVEPAVSKVKSLHFATEAAVAILRIDDFIKVNPKQEQGRGGH